ncbi:MAG: M23 family metallopeptidase [Roseivirga sp.]|nr:M23 family metallopeptidase [Roseivirga sp.]
MGFSTRHLFFFLLLISATISFAQVRPIKITSERDSNGNVVFYAQNNSSRNYHIVLTMTKLMSLRCDCQLPYEGNVGLGKKRLFKLIPDGLIDQGDWDYRWTSYEGFANPKIKEDVAYLIPVKSGDTVKTLGLQNLKDTYGDEKAPADFYAVGFKMNDGDKVFAARRGTVVEIKNGGGSSDRNLSYSKNSNSILIRHRDNSLARYSVLKNNSFMVEVGAEVEAGDAIALAGGENYTAGTHVRLMIYYLSFDKSKNEGTRYSWVYIKPSFATESKGNIQLDDGEAYTSLHTEALIIQEWTKRELKKKGKKKKK